MVFISNEIIQKQPCPICNKNPGFIGVAGQFICGECFANWKKKKDENLMNDIREANVTVQG